MSIDNSKKINYFKKIKKLPFGNFSNDFINQLNALDEIVELCKESDDSIPVTFEPSLNLIHYYVPPFNINLGHIP